MLHVLQLFKEYERNVFHQPCSNTKAFPVLSRQVQQIEVLITVVGV